ncbi:MAG TPA: type II toxin-antitoxin system ParD family antitoxin [Bacteroidetes bacterium]|nr:type II toxin-antitoxin system ParD family antitoxin [Bacteroidota bacterium]
MNVSLNPHYDSLIDKLVSSGQYNSASEVIRSGLRLLEQQNKEQELKTAYYKQEIQRGLDSGDAGSWNNDDFLKKAKARASK